MQTAPTRHDWGTQTHRREGGQGPQIAALSLQLNWTSNRRSYLRNRYAAKKHLTLWTSRLQLKHITPWARLNGDLIVGGHI